MLTMPTEVDRITGRITPTARVTITAVKLRLGPSFLSRVTTFAG